MVSPKRKLVQTKYRYFCKRYRRFTEIGVVVTSQKEFKFMAALICRKFWTSNVEIVDLEAILRRVKMAKDARL